MRLFILTIISVLLWSVPASAQPPVDWAANATLGANFKDYVEDVFVDASGNTYICGTFRGPLSIGSDNLYSGEASQVFVAKYDVNGNPVWALQSNGNNQSFAKSIFVDAIGAVYVTGYHNHTILSFAGLSLPSSSNEGLFLLKISPAGIPIHLTGATPLSTGKSRGAAVTGDGDFVYITGTHQGALTLNGGPTLPATAGQSDIFVARIDSAFAGFSYAVSHGGTSADLASSITTDGTNLYATGTYGNAVCTFTASPDYDLPAYGNEGIWITSFDKTNGNVNWATSAGSANGNTTSNDIFYSSSSLYITGGCYDVCTFVESPSTGALTYNDTIYTVGQKDAFIAIYNTSGVIQTKWSDGGPGMDEGFGITTDASCSDIQFCGQFEDSVDFGGTTMLHAFNKDLFVASYDNVGTLNWVFKDIGADDELAKAIHSNGTRTSYGGHFNSDFFVGTQPIAEIQWKGLRDFFVASFQCTDIPVCGPQITNCPNNDTLTSLIACNQILPNYISGLVVNDGCSAGLTFFQSPNPSTIINAGSQEVLLKVTDGTGNTDVCLFDFVVISNNNPVVAECGDQFVGETTLGDNNNYSSFSCSPVVTNGEERIYQVYVDANNHFLQVKMENASDSNDPYAYVYFLGSDCPTNLNCSQIDSFNIATGEFSNNSNYLTFIADGPGTYYIVVDAQVDHIDSYDISFFCTSSGVEFDGTCNVTDDPDGDGIVPSVNGSLIDLTMQPCESVTICHDMYLANLDDWQWVDSISMQLGDCYENINITTLTPDNPPGNNGYFDVNGDWSATYNLGTNTILWEFAHNSGEPWGDGNTGPYNCQLYSNFCFDADITSACANSEGLNIGIAIGDDGGKDGEPQTYVFDVGNSNDFILQDDNPFFSYQSNALCNADPNALPDSVTTSGGIFTADPGIVFTDGASSPTGEIDLTASTIGGPYNITYTVGLCPFDSVVAVNIYPQEDPAFTYPAAAYCQNDANPVATVTGTPGGTFTGPAEIVFVSITTGEIDLAASTAGGPYYITYTTPGPNCINADSVQITINAEDDPAFNYATIDHCAADANATVVSVTTPGGTFSEITANLSINSSTGEVDIVASTVGNYYAVYTTAGICPNTDSVQFNILTEDDPSFSYASAAYCQGDANPIPTISGTAGGTYGGAAEITFVSSTTGEVDLTNSLSGGPYTITYTTPGPDCPNVGTFDVTINAEDDPSFDYGNTLYCTGDSNPIANIIGTAGGTFSSSAGLVLANTSTGEIDIAGSTVGGPYTITYTTPGPDCPNSTDFQVSIAALEDAGFNYTTTSYCSNETDPVPTVNTPGGTFSGAVVFVDSGTGEIDLDATNPGTSLQIIYNSPGPVCPNADTLYLTINALDDPSFNYGDTAFCSTSSVVNATLNGTTGGVFTSSNTEISLNASSGQIDLGASTAGGPYTIQYATTGTCYDSSTVDIYIFDPVAANAGPDQTLFFKYDTDLEAIDPSPAIGVWSFSEGNANIDDINDPLAYISDLQNGTTTLLWTVTNGPCPVETDEVNLIVTSLFIPEAVTPNNDGQNDVFLINGIDLLENTVEIYNRWGQIVYSANNYQNNWDGLDNNGKKLDDDTYFYIITANNMTFKGYVVIKR
ncbi:gliding motility-associated C-terminal domain-containing protein [Paracrocinitomix mangrovi]|uniref:gliding motility-associated C-terminal domain-containing protein n=1 Tax=Paracrocinitomix mangrovi TaxID=2862509 RepID=UPI001C8D7396|nr:gliding motility-associated C-terminal domain-containing protein [Paracrocinitomix mangrovi]UKN01141.1 gliding motility-associated C-terminal domain-containing protein [Paracrocinitomix mangrovi]